MLSDSQRTIVARAKGLPRERLIVAEYERTPVVVRAATDWIRCAECGGRLKVETCMVCRGLGKVTRHEFQKWTARKQGRPSR